MADDRFFIPPPPPGTPKVEVPATPSPDAPRPIVPINAPVESATHRVPVRPPSPPSAPPAAAPVPSPADGEPASAPPSPPSAPPADAPTADAPPPTAPAPVPPLPALVPAPPAAPAASEPGPEPEPEPDRVSAPVTAESTIVRSVALVLPDGTRLAVGAAVVLGRDPIAPPTHPAARAVPVVDPAKSVSKTHALVVATAQGVEVHDLHSTNGVSVTRGGEREELAAGAVAMVAPGDRLALGLLEVAVELAEH